jgi:hypothetical protein
MANSNAAIVNAQNKPKYTPAQRLVLFAQLTRKYEQQNPTAIFADNTQLNLPLPKARFLSHIYLLVKGSFKAAHASKTSFAFANFGKYNLLKRVQLSINNGFNPYDISGNMLSIYNSVNKFSVSDSDPYGINVCGNTVSAAGTTNEVCFLVELPITVNKRDMIGLVNLQDPTMIASLNLTCGAMLDMIATADKDVTISNVNINITPIIESFSVPTNPDAIPDYSVLKLVHEQSENVVNTNEMTIKLPIGLIYRKFFIYLAQDANFTPIDTSKVAGFSIVFNQADSPVQVPAQYVAYKNTQDYDAGLPKGCYAFDFSTQGIANMGGGRDYIDSEKITEFWLKISFNNLTGSSNYVYEVSEQLAKLN